LLPSYCLQTIICEKLSKSFSSLFEKLSDSKVICTIENAAEAVMNSLIPERLKSAYQATNLKFEQAEIVYIYVHSIFIKNNIPYLFCFFGIICSDSFQIKIDIT
jgi:hypothetical protein